jgi:hypothetical protein
MKLEDIKGKKVNTITKSENGGYWVVLEDGSAVGFSSSLNKIDSNTFQTTVAVTSAPPKEETEAVTPDMSADEIRK